MRSACTVPDAGTRPGRNLLRWIGPGSDRVSEMRALTPTGLCTHPLG
jgi:hypothetical protein